VCVCVSGRHISQRGSSFFAIIAILTSFGHSMVKGRHSIYEKVSLPCRVRFRRGNVTKIELASSSSSFLHPDLSPLTSSPSLLGQSGPCFAISDVCSRPDGLMSRKMEDPRLRKPDILWTHLIGMNFRPTSVRFSRTVFYDPSGRATLRFARTCIDNIVVLEKWGLRTQRKIRAESSQRIDA